MRYLPLTDADRSAMLAAVGASDIDALFTDVPAEHLLDGPVEGLQGRRMHIVHHDGLKCH